MHKSHFCSYFSHDSKQNIHYLFCVYDLFWCEGPYADPRSPDQKLEENNNKKNKQWEKLFIVP